MVNNHLRSTLEITRKLGLGLANALAGEFWGCSTLSKTERGGIKEVE